MATDSTASGGWQQAATQRRPRHASLKYRLRIRNRPTSWAGQWKAFMDFIQHATGVELLDCDA
eukprot:11213983-Lingulodinium_polyedra.AAC.1